MKKIYRILFLCFNILIVSLTVFAEPLSVTDIAGRVITFEKTPERLLFLGAGSLRLGVYMQLAEKVVGIEAFEVNKKGGRPYIYAEPKLLELPVVTPGGPASINSMPDLEKILSVKPDVIFITYIDKDKAELITQKTGLKVVLLSYGKKFGEWDDALFKSFRIIGQTAQKSERAEFLISNINNEVKKMSEFKKTDAEAYIGGIGFRGFQDLRSSKSDYYPFGLAGIKNIISDKGEKGYVNISREKLVSLNPEIIFIDAMGLRAFYKNMLKEKYFYNSLKAFKNKKVFKLYPYNFYMTNIISVLADGYIVRSVIDGGDSVNTGVEQFERLSLIFFGKSVYPQMEKFYGKAGEQISLN